MATHRTTRTPVAIVGAGPAGLMLSHLLHLAGVDSVVVDHRTREEIVTTARAGILEHDTVRLLVDSGASERVLGEGVRHDGVELAFAGGRHRLDLLDLVGASVWLYPQTAIFEDLAGVRERDGGDVRYGVSRTRVLDVDSESPRVLFTDASGEDHELSADFLVGADGSRSLCRRSLPEGAGTRLTREYPYAWFGILCEAPPSAPELVYSHSRAGFALVSQRTASVQRMYFQCDPAADPDTWSDDRVWSAMAERLSPNGVDLVEGPITSRAVLRFRSSVHEPMQYGRLLLAGDAAHTVPPTGAKGLNLALADVRVLAEALVAARNGDDRALHDYTARALRRVWQAQHFSYWMTTMLHLAPGGSEFDVRRQEAELASVVASRAGSAHLADGYTGWPGR